MSETEAKYWLLVVWGDIEPETFGPWSWEHLLNAARKRREKHGDDDGLFYIHTVQDIPIVEAFSGADLDPIPEEAVTKTYSVNMCRTGYGNRDIIVEARNLEEAREKALDEAGNHSYTEKHSDYTIDCVREIDDE